VLAASNNTGVPLYVRPHPGNSAETYLPRLGHGRPREAAAPGLLVVADSWGMSRVCSKPTVPDGASSYRYAPAPASSTGSSPTSATRACDPYATSPAANNTSEPPSAPNTAAVRDFDVADPTTNQVRHYRVAYIWSSEEAASIPDARERALVKTDADLGRVQRELGGRHYETCEQLQARLVRILGSHLHGLLPTTVTVQDAKPVLTWSRHQATIDTAARPTLPRTRRIRPTSTCGKRD
jgi:hypothetical protein